MILTPFLTITSGCSTLPPPTPRGTKLSSKIEMVFDISTSKLLVAIVALLLLLAVAGASLLATKLLEVTIVAVAS